MLRYFRRTRQKWLNNGNTKKYLVYAIGEVLLVVLGIIIALQLNNANEARKERILEKEILLEIKDALQKDLGDLKWNYQAHIEILQSQQILINWMDSDDSFHDSLAHHFSIANRTTNLISVDGPYENLKSIGIRIIKNPELRNLIMAVYDNRYDNYAELEKIYTQAMLHAANSVNISFFEAYMSFDVNNPPNFYGTMKPLDPAKIKGSDEIKYFIKSQSNLNQMLIELGMKNTIGDVEHLIELISKEVEN